MEELQAKVVKLQLEVAELRAQLATCVCKCKRYQKCSSDSESSSSAVEDLTAEGETTIPDVSQDSDPVTKIMEEMDSADTVHAVPCHSSVDLVDVVDSLLGFTPGLRSQSSSKSPSPTRSASPPPPLPMQPPPSATAARMFGMMFEPVDKFPPPSIAPEIFQSIDIVTSSPKSPTSPQKQRHSSSSSSSSDSSHSSNDCDVNKSSTEQPPISPKTPAVAESSDKEIEQPPIVTISTEVSVSLVPEVIHHTKEDSSDDETAKAPIILQTPNFDISNSSQEVDDDPKESIQLTTDVTVFSLPHMTLVSDNLPDTELESSTITYHINDYGYQPGEISVAQEKQESSTSEDDDDDEDKLRSPTKKLTTKSGSSDSDSDDGAPVVLIKPPLYVDDAITSTPAHSVDVVQLNDEKYQPEELTEKQDKHYPWYDELKSTVRRRRSKSASSDSSNENDVGSNMSTKPPTEEIVVIAPIKNDEWYNELKSTVKQRRSKSGSSESSNEIEVTPNESIKPAIEETVVISSPPHVFSQSEVILNEEAFKPEIGPIIHRRDVHSSPYSSDEENTSSMRKLDSSLSSNETHNYPTKSKKHSVTFLPSLVARPVEGDSLNVSFDSTNSDVTPLVTVRPYVQRASFFTPVLITKPAHSNDVVLVNNENSQSEAQLVVVHGSSSSSSSDDESQSAATLQQPKPDSSNLQIMNNVASPKNVQPTVDLVVEFLPPTITKPSPSTNAVSAANVKFQPDNTTPAVNHKGHFSEKPRYDSDCFDSSIDTHDELSQPIKAKFDVTYANIKKYQSEDYPGLSSMVSSVVRNKKDSSDDESLTHSPVIAWPKMDTEPFIVPVVPIVSMKPSVVVTDIPPDTVSLAKEKINLHNITGQPSPPPPVSVKQGPSTEEKSRKYEKHYQPGKFVTMASIDKSAAHNKEEESDDDETIKSLTDLLPPSDSSTSSDDQEVFASNKLQMKETHFHTVSAPEDESDLQTSTASDSAPISRTKRPGFSPPPPPATDPPPKQPVMTTQATSTNQVPESNGKFVKNSSTSNTKATDSHSDTDEDNEATESAVILRRAGVKCKEAFTLSRMTLASTNTDVHSLNSTRHSTFMGSMPELTCNRKSLTEVPVDESIQVRCTSPFCPNIVPLEVARKTYKTCHNCAAFYCSRECRRSHWDRHKKQCMYGKVKLVLKQVLKKVVDDKAVHNELSRSARAGFLSHERGFVKLIFRNSELALKFVKHGVKALQDFPIYVGWRDLIPQETGSDVYQTIIDLCQRYKPETRMVVLAAVCVTKEIPVHAIPQWERQIVARCAKLHLSKSVISDFKKGVRGEPYMMVVNGSEALVQARGHGVSLSPKKARKVCFEGIQAQLWERGVRLETQHPEAYKKLKAYVDRDEPFEPIIIQPRDGRTGRTFMCLITPEISNSSASVNTSQKSSSSDKSKEKTRF